MEGVSEPSRIAEIHREEPDRGRGGGGKIRRERKPPSTPYDRPPRSRWISRLVDPAKRIFSGLPSLFSSSSSIDQVDDEVHTEVEQEAGNAEENYSTDLDIPESSGRVGPSEDKGKSILDISDDDGLDKKAGSSEVGAPDIEQLIKEKTFSREEIDHLMKILHSRAVTEEQDRKPPSMTSPDNVDRAGISKRGHKTSLDEVHEEEELNRFQLATSTPLSRPAMQDAIGASPIDIARAYMGSRTSEKGFTSTVLTRKTEKVGFSSELSSYPVSLSPLRKSPICWPGAITQNQSDYSMPQSQCNRSSLRSFSRTPYSRTIYSKSKSKLTPLRGESDRFPSISPVPFQPTATPAYEKVQSFNNLAEGSYGTGGPIRRTRNKFTLATPAKESNLFTAARRSPLARESSVDFMPKKTFELGSSSNTNIESVKSKTESPEAVIRSVHPHSNRLARRILEQLDRPITLKDQSKELKLAVSWKDSAAAASSPTTAQNSNPSSLVRINMGKSNSVDNVNFVNGESNVLPSERNNTLIGAGKDVFGSTMFEKTTSISDVNNGPLQILGKLDSQSSSEQGMSNNLPKTSLLFGDTNKIAAAITENVARSESQHFHRKPILPSIAIEKPGLRTTFSSIASPGFTFPVTTSSTTTAEPPTPSIVPSFSTSPPQQPKVSPKFPTFNFSNKITIAPPVVASTPVTRNDASVPKFKFGSEKPRLCFAIAGENAPSAPNDADIPKFKFGSEKRRLNFGIASDAVCC